MLSVNGWRRWSAAGATAVLALGVAGCGSSDDDQASESGGTAAAVSGDSGPGGGGKGPIKLRSIAAVGSGLTNYPDVEAGTRAAAEAINAAGGVDGRKIELSFCNTRGEANQAVACAREAAKDGVAAVVGRVDIFATQSSPVLEKAKIPDIGMVSTGTESDYESPMSYPIQAGNFGTYSATPFAFAEAGAKSMVTLSVDLPIGIRQAEVAERAAKAAGVSSAGIIKAPAQGVTDYTPYAQQVKDKKVDAALIMVGPQGLQAFLKAADAIGLKSKLAMTIFSFGESEAAAVGTLADGVLSPSPYPAPRDVSVPGVKKFNDDLDAAGVSNDASLRRSAGLNAWLSVYAAAEVAKSIEGDVTNESMVAALNAAEDVDLQGLATWSPANLGGADGGAFPRFPDSDYHVLEFRGGKPVDSGMAPVEAPLKSVR